MNYIHIGNIAVPANVVAKITNANGNLWKWLRSQKDAPRLVIQLPGAFIVR